MNRPDPEPTPTPAETAIDEVLAAERSARDEVAECQRQGETIRDLGRAQARRIAARAEERITALHLHSEATLRRTVATIAAEARAFDAPSTPLDAQQLSRLDRVIAALAAELAGGSP